MSYRQTQSGGADAKKTVTEKIMNLKIAVYGVVACGILNCYTSSVQAEGHVVLGSEAHGVNRVVRTKGDPVNRVTGFTGVKGTVNISFVMPTQFDSEANAQVVTKDVNPCDNKPSAYLGGTTADVTAGTREVDAGLQFEPETWVTKPDPQPGWAAFISTNNLFSNVRVYDPSRSDGVPWRVPSGIVERNGKKWAAGSGQISTTMEYTVALSGDPGNAGSAKLKLANAHPGSGTSGTFYWNPKDPPSPFNDDLIGRTPSPQNPVAPWRGLVVFKTANLNYSSVKRVVAMTRRRLDDLLNDDGSVKQKGSGQKSNFLLDGSELTCAFTVGQVRPAGGTFRTWGSSDIQQSATGYDAPGDAVSAAAADPAWDQLWPYKPERSVEESSPPFNGWRGRKTSDSRTVVEFTGTNNVNARKGPANAGTTGRYANETVRINLRTSTRPMGDVIEWAVP
jgi:hypothetical protein